MEHFVKSWPPFFWDAVRGKKNFDLRKDDRDYQVGDTLVQQEYDPELQHTTGRKNRREITYVMRAEEIPKSWGLKEGYCILGLEPIKKKEKPPECPKSLNAGFHSTDWQNGDGACCWCGEEVKK